jgi:hypothetical protein
MATTYDLDIDRIMRSIRQRKATGGFVPQSFINDVLGANIQTAASRAAADKSLSMQEARDATQKEQFTASQAFSSAEAEKSRLFNEAQAEKNRESAGKQSMTSAITQIPSTILTGKYLYNAAKSPEVVPKPGVKGSESNPFKIDVNNPEPVPQNTPVENVPNTDLYQPTNVKPEVMNPQANMPEWLSEPGLQEGDAALDILGSGNPEQLAIQGGGDMGLDVLGGAGLETGALPAAEVAGDVGLDVLGGAGGGGAGIGAGTGFSAGLGALGGTAAIGGMAPTILNTIRPDATEEIGHDLTLGLVRDEGAADFIGSAGTGAGAGALAGTYIWPGVGTVVGGVVGGAVGGLTQILRKSCIVLSYLYGAESKEVRTAKVFCGRRMTIPRLVGYYQIAHNLVNLMEKYHWMRKPIEKIMARPFVNYMRWKLGHIKEVSVWSKVFSPVFLTLCTARYYLGENSFYPKGADKCIASITEGKKSEMVVNENV